MVLLFPFLGLNKYMSDGLFHFFSVLYSCCVKTINTVKMRPSSAIWNHPSRCVPLHKKWSFLLRISFVNVSKSAGYCGFGHIYWINSLWKTFLCVVFTTTLTLETTFWKTDFRDLTRFSGDCIFSDDQSNRWKTQVNALSAYIIFQVLVLFCW